MSEAARRRPSSSYSSREPPGESPGEASLQLAIARDGVGLELSAPVAFGAVVLAEANAQVMGVAFPLDVSGGVERFRHRRTWLKSARLEIAPAAAERWLAAMATGLVRDRASSASQQALEAVPSARLTWGKAPLNARIELTCGEAQVAFDVAFAFRETALIAHAYNARALGLDGPATVFVGRWFERIASQVGGSARGLRLEIAQWIEPFALEAFVCRGARCPRNEGLVATGVSLDEARGAWGVDFARDGKTVAPPADFASLEELDRLVSNGDQAFVTGTRDEAREAYLRALEKAPHHPWVLMRLAELDAAHGERDEASLSWLTELEQNDQASTRDELPKYEPARTFLAAALTSRQGKTRQACDLFERGGEIASTKGEHRIAARAFAAAAALVSANPNDANARATLVRLLDRSIAESPREASARWQRARTRAISGDVDGAREDLQHIEAQARGREARHAALVGAARLWVEAALYEEAVVAYERALRFAPDEATTLFEYARALRAAGALSKGEIGETTRAVAILGRATRAPGATPALRALASIELARLLSDEIGDIPAAIARLSDIADDEARGPFARAFEGSLRGRLSDRAEALQMFALAAELFERRPLQLDPGARDEAREAAAFFREAEELARDEEALSRRFAKLAAALDGENRTRAQTTQIPQNISPPASPSRETPPELPSPLPSSLQNSLQSPFADSPLDTSEESSSANDEADAENLLARVKSNPDDAAAVDDLVDILARLGRDFELFALLQARYDDADEATRRAIAPKQREALERLATVCERAGRAVEASLYRDAARMLEP